MSALQNVTDGIKELIRVDSAGVDVSDILFEVSVNCWTFLCLIHFHKLHIKYFQDFSINGECVQNSSNGEFDISGNAVNNIEFVCTQK